MMADHAQGVANRGQVVSPVPLVEQRKIGEKVSANGSVELKAERGYTRCQRVAWRQRVMP
jgi:hypothetical protein